MKVLVIGSGGREHAMVWRLAQSPKVTHLFVAPGNPGTALEPKTKNIPIAVHELKALRDFALENHIDLSIVGPEGPLVAGIVDEFSAHGLKCFGPSAYCAQLEGSKSFAKDFLKQHGIPTAAYALFEDLNEALAYVQTRPLPMVIKADGLAAGKGVFIARERLEALAAVTSILGEQQFGAAGARIVVEDFLNGEEASFMVIAHGTQAITLATSQDHKARDEGDRGPNTGGMGAYSPAPVVSPTIHQKIMDTIIFPTLHGLNNAGHPYTGFLYAGLMINTDGSCQVLEFNCRLGDPETQPLMLRLDSCLATLCLAAIEGTLENTPCHWDPRPALGVVLCSQGYPEHFPTGEVIEGLSQLPVLPDQKMFQAGTTTYQDQTLTAGGRVLTATALGNTLQEAQEKAYALAEKVRWPHRYYRKDIGYRALNPIP